MRSGRFLTQLVVLRTLDSGDWAGLDNATLVNWAQVTVPDASVGMGQVATFIEWSSGTVDALPSMIDVLAAKGYSFVTMVSCA